MYYMYKQSLILVQKKSCAIRYRAFHNCHCMVKSHRALITILIIISLISLLLLFLLQCNFTSPNEEKLTVSFFNFKLLEAINRA